MHDVGLLGARGHSCSRGLLRTGVQGIGAQVYPPDQRRPGTDRGRRGSRSGRRPGRRATSTKPSTRPRCRWHTSSGWASASSAVGAVGEGDVGAVAVGRHGRVEAELGQLARPAPRRRRRRRQASAAARPGPGRRRPPRRPRRRPRPPRRSSSRASEREGGGSRPSEGASGAMDVAVLGPAHAAPGVGCDLEQADVAHALEVGPHGVGVQVEGLGHLGGRQRAWPIGPARGRWRSGCCRRAP